MKATKLFFLILLILSGNTLLGESFHINLSNDLVNKRQFGAAIVSNQLGEILFTYLKTEAILEDDIVIRLDIDATQDISVTIIKNHVNFFMATTYVNVLNNCRIEDYQDHQYNRGKRKQLTIDEVSSFEEMRIYGSSIDRGMRNSLDGTQLSLSFSSMPDIDDYVVFRLNGDNQRRYFYSDSDDLDIKLQIEDLYSKLDNYHLDLFKTANWRLRIIGIAASTGNKVYLFKDFKKRVNQFNFSIASEIDIDKFQIYLESNSVEYYEEFDQIPSEYNDVDIEIISEYIDDFGFKYSTTNEEVDFFQAEYNYNSGSRLQGMTVVSKWTMIGVFQNEIEYELPIIPEEVIKRIPSLAFATSPGGVLQKLGVIFTEGIEDDWISPHQFLNTDWRLEKGVNIKYLYHYFGK